MGKIDTDYLFIVGLGRSGTKLVLNVLRLSPDLTVVSAGETGYMGKLLTKGLRASVAKVLASDAANKLDEIADVCINDSPDISVWADIKAGRIPRSELCEALAEQELTEQGVYTAILRLRARSDTGPILHIDKTPQNLYHLNEIMDWFPTARSIHMIRDPRAVLASAWTKRMRLYPRGVYLSLRLPRKVYSAIIVVHIALTWMYAVRLHRRYAKKFPGQYLLIRFEDLVLNSEPTIRKLAAFLEIQYTPSMMQPRSIGSSFGSHGTGMDENALTRYRTVLKPWMVKLLQLFCARSMRAVGYDPTA